MNEDIDIENILKRYRSDPSPKVRRSVLSRFTHTFGSREPVSLWKKPIPLYLVAAKIVIAVGISFFAGQRMAQPERQPEALHEPIQENSITTQEIKWEVAVNDLL